MTKGSTRSEYSSFFWLAASIHIHSINLLILSKASCIFPSSLYHHQYLFPTPGFMVVTSHLVFIYPTLPTIIFRVDLRAFFSSHPHPPLSLPLTPAPPTTGRLTRSSSSPLTPITYLPGLTDPLPIVSPLRGCRDDSSVAYCHCRCDLE